MLSVNLMNSCVAADLSTAFYAWYAATANMRNWSPLAASDVDFALVVGPEDSNLRAQVTASQRLLHSERENSPKLNNQENSQSDN
jgi:hypothetical protein